MSKEVKLVDGLDHLPLLASLCETWDYDSYEKVYASLTTPKTSYYLKLAHVQTDLLGGVFVYDSGESFDILYIYVNPDCRGKGVGRKLLEHLKQFVCSSCCEHIFLEVRQSNTAAIQLYLKSNFVQVGQRKRYYADKEDALVFRWSVCLEGLV